MRWRPQPTHRPQSLRQSLARAPPETNTSRTTGLMTLLITHPCFVNHDTGPGHPERADRMRAIDKVLSHEIFGDLVRREAPLRDDADAAILRVHPQSYLDRIKSKAPGEGDGPAYLDGDTRMSSGSLEAALRCLGAALDAVDAVFEADPAQRQANAFCQVRPPGHHAERETAMGFCLFSTIAIAAKYAQAKHGAERVAVVDFDVHHGNGTQDVFWNDPTCLFASTHQMPLYPGSGAAGERGEHNTIVNAPLSPGDGGEPFGDAMRSRIFPALDAFKPDLILISAGFDAHANDPLANLQLVEADFAWATEELMARAQTHCDGRLVSMLEGGYDLRGLAGSVAVHVKTLMGA